jgi:hypothetical protein
MRRTLLLLAMTAAALPGAALAQDDSLASPGHPGWRADARTGCRLWDFVPDEGGAVTWSGPCPGGVAEGDGAQVWTSRGGVTEIYVGHMADGRADGEGSDMQLASGGSYAGRWRAGHLEGHGIRLYGDGSRYEGEYAHDDPNGPGTLTRGGRSITAKWVDGCATVEGQVISTWGKPEECAQAK